MKARRHEHRRKVQPDDARKYAGERHADPQHRERDDRKGLLPDDQQYECCREREEAWKLTQALQDSDLDTCEIGALDDKIVEQS